MTVYNNNFPPELQSLGCQENSLKHFQPLIAQMGGTVAVRHVEKRVYELVKETKVQREESY